MAGGGSSTSPTSAVHRSSRRPAASAAHPRRRCARSDQREHRLEHRRDRLVAQLLADGFELREACCSSTSSPDPLNSSYSTTPIENTSAFLPCSHVADPQGGVRRCAHRCRRSCGAPSCCRSFSRARCCWRRFRSRPGAAPPPPQALRQRPHRSPSPPWRLKSAMTSPRSSRRCCRA